MAARPLRGDLVLVPTSCLSEASRKALESAGAVQRVFQADDATLIALPEVRVEDSSLARRKALRRWLDEHPDVAQVSHIPLNGVQRQRFPLCHLAVNSQLSFTEVTNRYLGTRRGQQWSLMPPPASQAKNVRVPAWRVSACSRT